MPSSKLLDCHPLLVDRVRLSILAALAAAKGETPFGELLEALGVTKGNLSSHARKLEVENLIVVQKIFEGRVPKTTYKITKKGTKELIRFTKNLSAMVGTS